MKVYKKNKIKYFKYIVKEKLFFKINYPKLILIKKIVYFLSFKKNFK